MARRELLDIEYEEDILQANIDLMGVQMNMLEHIRNRMRRRRRIIIRRQWWQRPWLRTTLRRQFGLYDQLMQELRRDDPRSFRKFMRMPAAMFDKILERVGPFITKQYTNCREPLDPGLKLALTLRHLASGTKYMDMRYGWRVAHNTLSKVVREVCNAIIHVYKREVLPLPTTPEEWKAIADKYQRRWNFPNTIGALDGKHVAIKCPPRSGSEYYNYKKFYSIVLLALVDADYKFIWVDIGGRGPSSDAQIWNDSDLKEAMDNRSIPLPAPRPMPHDDEPMSYFIEGDDAFALRPTMMKPYSKSNLTREERLFNYRLSRARRVVENAFGILANRF